MKPPKILILAVLLVISLIPTIQYLSGAILLYLSLRGLILTDDFPVIGKQKSGIKAVVWILALASLLSSVQILMLAGAIILLLAAYRGL